MGCLKLTYYEENHLLAIVGNGNGTIDTSGGSGNNGNHYGQYKVDYEKKQKLSKEALYAAYYAAGMQPFIPTAGNSGKIPYGQLKKYFNVDTIVKGNNGNGNNGNNGNGNSGNGSNPDTTSTTKPGKYENLQFFYHPDHLGSSNYITDLSGEVYQHNEYFPYGETFVEERNAAEYTNYLFSGKELDEETGFYYFGARYQDPRTSIFLNVDPHADRYPWQSPYMYCSGNPLNRIDPDGRDDYKVDGSGNISRLKDQSNAIDGKDRLIRSNWLGKVKFNKDGTTKGNSITVDEGTFHTRKDGENTGVSKFFGNEQVNKDGSVSFYNATVIHVGENEQKAAGIFEFLSANTNVEWSLLGGDYGKSGFFSLSTSHMRGAEPFGTDFGDNLSSANKLLYHIHNHHYNFTPSPDGDISFRERNANSGATFGIYIPGRGYRNYDGNSIQIPRRK